MYNIGIEIKYLLIREGWDSNPCARNRTTNLANWHLKPLGHLPMYTGCKEKIDFVKKKMKEQKKKKWFRFIG